MNIIIALLVFSFIVLIHELGHFLLAKRAGIKVEEFSIGMGPRIFTVKGKETNYSIKLLPLGGSCMMLGEDEDEEKTEGSFNSKGVLDRFLVIFAGPFFNFILAFVISVLIITNVGIDRPYVAEAISGYPASEAGIEAGDEILQLDNKNITIYREIPLYVYMHPGKTIEVKVRRGEGQEAQILNFSLVPKYSTERGNYLIGIRPENRVMLKNPLSVIAYSLNEVRYNISMTVEGLAHMVRGKLKADQISGPVAIVKAIGDTVEESKPDGFRIVLLNLGAFMALLSANLGVMNLLPIPPLDGGKILIEVIQLVIRRPLSLRVQTIMSYIGIAFFVFIFVFALRNDIVNIVMG